LRCDGVVVEAFSPDYLGDIMRIERSCFPLFPYPPQTFLDIWADASSEFLVALGDDEVIGYIATLADGSTGHLLSLAVMPSRRREGIGSLLLNETIAPMKERGLSLIRLEVRATNETALGFYSRHGFTVVNRRRNYYPDGESALVMEREL
jgi:ribosomal-protein-alanine N-acetyltransferase